MAKIKSAKPHRYLFNKTKLIKQATAALALEPNNTEARAYLGGLCDGLHGTRHEKTAAAIHMARQVIIASREG